MIISLPLFMLMLITTTILVCCLKIFEALNKGFYETISRFTK